MRGVGAIALSFLRLAVMFSATGWSVCVGQTPVSSRLVVGARITLTQAVNGVDGELQILKDERITASIAKTVWNKGAFEGKPEDTVSSFKELPPRNAQIRVVDRHGKVIDSEKLERPLARLGIAKLYADSKVTYSVTVDYSAGFGSYSGPITSFVEVSGGHLSWLEAVDHDGKHRKVSVMSSLKTAWRIAPVADGGREILEAACRPTEKTLKTGDDFQIIYSRYYFDGTQWRLVSRKVPGFSEFEDGFPRRSRFP